MWLCLAILTDRAKHSKTVFDPLVALVNVDLLVKTRKKHPVVDRKHFYLPVL